jgi:hypothetical protein
MIQIIIMKMGGLFTEAAAMNNPYNQPVKYAHCVCRIAFSLREQSTVYGRS